MNLTEFFSNPVGFALSSYTDVLGMGFYIFLIVIVDGYVLIKSESWGVASAVAILMAIVFSAIIPAVIGWIWVVMVAFSLAAVIVDVFVLK